MCLSTCLPMCALQPLCLTDIWIQGSLVLISHSVLSLTFGHKHFGAKCYLNMNVHRDGLPVVVELLVQRALEMQLVGRHHELLGHLHAWLVPDFAWGVHYLGGKEARQKKKPKTGSVSTVHALLGTTAARPSLQ